MIVCDRCGKEGGKYRAGILSADTVARPEAMVPVDLCGACHSKLFQSVKAFCDERLDGNTKGGT